MKDVNLYPPGQFTPLSCCKQAHATFSISREEVGSIFWPLLLSGVLNSAAGVCWALCGPEYIDGGVEAAALLVLREGGVGEGGVGGGVMSEGGGGNRQQRGGKSRPRHSWKPGNKRFYASK
jgi:hypothetical protein